jgi:hypothetical protein
MKPDEYGTVSDRVHGLESGGNGTSDYPGAAPPGKVNYKYLLFLLALFLFIIVSSFYLEKSVNIPVLKSSVSTGNCSDGTPINKCSATLPMYCMSGELVERASLCGCPDDYAVNGSGCLRVQRCEDGTLYSKCSNKKPFFCSKGKLLSNSSLCGCPADYVRKGENCEKIRKCRDGTVYGECSMNKPLYCRDGRLVNDSKTCGCPDGYDLLGDGCVSPYEGSPDERILPYTLKGKASALKIAVHASLKQYLAKIPRVYYCNPKCPTPQQLEMRYLEDDKQRPELLNLVEKIKGLTQDPADRARIAISFVQNIPYDTDSAEAGNLTNRYPYEVLFDQRGVCGEKSRLLAFILREIGYGVYLLDYEKEDHMAVALKCPVEYAQYTYNNTGYCFLETTRVSILTDNTGEYSSDGGKLETIPSLLTVSSGREFPAKDEYSDAQDWIALNERASSSGGILEQEDYSRWKEIKEKYGIPTLKSDLSS